MDVVDIVTIVEEVMVMEEKDKISIKKVLHILKFKRYLILVVKLALNGLKMAFYDDADIVRAANRKDFVRFQSIEDL